MRFGDQYGRIKACGEKVYEEALEKAAAAAREESLVNETPDEEGGEENEDQL